MENINDKLKPNFYLNIINSTNNEIQELLIPDEDTQENKGIFIIKSANDWLKEAKNKPISKMLFDEFWYQDEICILFADTNLGKSILAVQIGDSISKGENILGFKLESEKQNVLYFDFELSDRQFENRYSKKKSNHYCFDDGFIRIEINPNVEIPEKIPFEDFLYKSIEKAIIETGTKVLIIDNLTYLKNETEKAKNALPLMKDLKKLKSKYNLSILALAHTPKRDSSKPIVKNDLQGSKMLINLCDSSFTIGESQKDKNIRYLKQIKVRQNEFIYDTENVCVFNVDKPDNFLKFEFLEYGNEKKHLKEISNKDVEETNNQIIDYHRQGLSFREIGGKVGYTHTKVHRIIKKLT